MDPSFFDVDLDELDERIWSTLTRAAADASHDWHWPSVASVEDGEPRLRTVVLREASRPYLVFHTDLRTPKVDQLRKNNQMAWLFYDSSSRVQLRARGQADIQTGRLDLWRELDPASRANYCASDTPGTAVEDRTDGLDGIRENPTVENTAHGLENFAVVRCEVRYLDWLWLARGEHRRASFDLSSGDGQWVIP